MPCFKLRYYYRRLGLLQQNLLYVIHTSRTAISTSYKSTKLNQTKMRSRQEPLVGPDIALIIDYKP